MKGRPGHPLAGRALLVEGATQAPIIAMTTHEPPTRDYNLKRALSWALYDWANSAFATTVMAGFFPIFFKQYWATGVDAGVSTFRLGAANSIAAVIVAVMAPVLGYIADRGATRKRFLLFFLTLGVITTACLGFVGKGSWLPAITCYALAVVGFAGGNVFYDSLILAVSGKKKMDFVSALGYGLGYLGGGLLFALNVWMALSPHTFGFESSVDAIKMAFIAVAVWWAAFSVPLFLNVKEAPATQDAGQNGHALTGLQEMAAAFRKVREARTIFLFLLGYWLYIDGVDTIVIMAVDYGMSLGFSSDTLIKALLITQFVGFPAAIAFGRIGEKLGTKTGILIGLMVYIGVAIWGFFMHREGEFYALAVAVGLVQGGVQSLSRAFYAKLIPEENSGQFFGFYNMLGKFGAILGPVLMGCVSVVTGHPRYSILSVIALFISGAAVLCLVRQDNTGA